MGVGAGDDPGDDVGDPGITIGAAKGFDASGTDPGAMAPVVDAMGPACAANAAILATVSAFAGPVTVVVLLVVVCLPFADVSVCDSFDGPLDIAAAILATVSAFAGPVIVVVLLVVVVVRLPVDVVNDFVLVELGAPIAADVFVLVELGAPIAADVAEVADICNSVCSPPLVIYP